VKNKGGSEYQLSNELAEVKESLETQVAKRTTQLGKTIKKLRQEIAEHKKVQAELKKNHEYLEKLNNSLREVIFTVKMPERTISYVNRSVRDVFGYKEEECLGRTTEFLYPSQQEYLSFGDKLKGAMQEGEDALHTEYLLRRKNGEVFPAEIITTFLKEDGRITQVISIVRDITRRRRAEDGLRLSEARLTEAQRIAHLGNWDWDIVKNELVWSDEIYRIFGLTPQQFGATYEAFLNSVHPGDREFVEQSVNEALYEGRPYSIDHRIVLPDGTIRVVHEEAEVTFNESNRPIRMVGTVHDITELKRAESELRALSNELVRSQEEERRNIARELHDQIGQSLTVLRLVLDKAKRSSAEDIGSVLAEADAVVGEIAAQLREISLNLRPSMLDNLGLLPAFLWHFEQYTAKTQVRVDFKHAGLWRNFPPEISTAAYRIVQEALTNIVRHAGVNEAFIRAWVDQETLWLRIEDKGNGFDPQKLAVGTSSGLYGMRERALSLGGKLTVESTPGVGTVVTAELPLSGDQNIK
jgi:PAS domain S-box-containing protein